MWTDDFYINQQFSLDKKPAYIDSQNIGIGRYWTSKTKNKLTEDSFLSYFSDDQIINNIYFLKNVELGEFSLNSKFDYYSLGYQRGFRKNNRNFLLGAEYIMYEGLTEYNHINFNLGIGLGNVSKNGYYGVNSTFYPNIFSVVSISY